VKKLLYAAALAAAVSILLGCGPKPAVEPEAEQPEAEPMEERAEPPTAEEPGATVEPGEVEAVPEIGFGRIHFDTDKWNIKEEAREILKKNADLLREHSEIAIIIEGHCDERNTVEYNLALGERRAEATRKYLIKLGIDASRLNTISYGEERSIAYGHDESSWWQNRRAEFAVAR